MLFHLYKSDADVIMIGHGAAHLIALAYPLKFLTKKKIVLDVRTVPVDLESNISSSIVVLRYKMALFFARLFCDGITCITSFLKEILENQIPRLHDKVHVLSSAVDFKIFDPDKASSLSEKLGLNKKFVVIYHGILSPNRGLQNVIKALPLAIKKIPNLLFLVVGLGPAEAELKDLTNDLGVKKHVLFTGKVPFYYVPSYIKSADVAIIPMPNIDWWNLNSPIKTKRVFGYGNPCSGNRHTIAPAGR